MRWSFLWALVGNLSHGLAQFATLSLLAKLTTAAVVGQFALALAIINPALAFCGLQLRSVVASDAAQQHTWSTYLRLRIASNTVMFLCVLCIAWSSCDAETLRLVIVLALWKLGGTMSDLSHGLLQRYERMDCIGRSQLLSGILQCGALAFGLLATKDLLQTACLMATTSWLVFLSYDWPCTQRWTKTPIRNATSRKANRHAVLSLAWKTLPLGLVVMVGSLTTNLPRYFLGHYVDLTAVGLLAALICPTTVSQQVMLALTQVTLPRFARHLREHDLSAFRRLTANVIAVNSIVGLTTLAVGVCFGRVILSRLYTAEYIPFYDCFVWLSAASALNCLSALGGVLTATGWYRSQLVVALVTFSATSAGCGLLVPRYGVKGAAIALFLVAVIRLVVVSAAVWRVLSTLSFCDAQRMPSTTRRSAHWHRLRDNGGHRSERFADSSWQNS